MDISLQISAQDMAASRSEVDTLNKVLSEGKTTPKAGGEMGKDEFLKILVTQLSHQDPTQPMEDKEFIAQLAQFSSLEQMTNMNTSLGTVASLIAQNQALSILGSTVTIADETSGVAGISGIVEEVTGGSFPQILVNGTYYDFSQVHSVRTNKKE